LSTIKSFWQDGGIFEAKIFYNPVKEVVSTCHLQGEKNSPMISLVEMGLKPRLGVLMKNGKGKPDFSGIELNHLKTNKFYIFSLRVGQEPADLEDKQCSGTPDEFPWVGWACSSESYKPGNR
jgi:hypothetical protein